MFKVWIKRHKGRLTERKTDRQTDRQTEDTQTDGQTGTYWSNLQLIEKDS